MVHSSDSMSSSNSSNCSNSINNYGNGGGGSASNITSTAGSTKISPSSSGITTPTRISIKEANDHLQLLHSRVSELEEIIRSQSDSYAEQEDILKRQLKELKSAKEAQIDELTKTIIRLEEKCKDLESSIKLKNEKLEENQTRLAQVDQLTDLLPNLEKLIVSLKHVTLTDENVIPSSTSIIDKESSSSSLINSPSIGFLDQQRIDDKTTNTIEEHDESVNLMDELKVDSHDDIPTIPIIDSIDTYPSLIDMACQTDICGINGGLIKSDSNERKNIETNANDLITVSSISTIGALCSSEPCYSKRLSIDETVKKDVPDDPRPTTLSINGNGIDPVPNSDKQIRNTRSNRSRRMRKSSSIVNNHSSSGWEKDFYCGPSLTNPIFGLGRTIGYKIHSNGGSSSPHHLSNKVERSFSITSNFSEDEDFPSNGTRTSIMSHNDYLN